MKTLGSLIISSFFLLISMPAYAAEDTVVDDVMQSVEEGFSELERKMIERYYKKRHGEEQAPSLREV